MCSAALLSAVKSERARAADAMPTIGQMYSSMEEYLKELERRQELEKADLAWRERFATGEHFAVLARV